MRTYFRTLRDLGVASGDPTLDLALPPRTTTAARPLTDDEVIACRYAVRLGHADATSLQRAVCWALAEATGITSEITQVRVADLDDEDQPRWVRLMGSKRAQPRLGQLTDWGSRIVRRQVEVLLDAGASTTVLLTYRGRAVPGQHVAQASAANAIAETLRAAGLGDEADVRPASVRNWAGRRLYVDGMPIEQVALRLGARQRLPDLPGQAVRGLGVGRPGRAGDRVGPPDPRRDPWPHPDPARRARGRARHRLTRERYEGRTLPGVRSSCVGESGRAASEDRGAAVGLSRAVLRPRERSRRR